MAHNLSQVNGVTEMVAVGDRWHGLGQYATQPMTAKEALEMSHLDWTVHSSPVEFTPHDGGPRVACEDRVVQHRITPDGKAIYLGVVSKLYETIQNIECFDLMEAIVGEGRGLFESAGALRQGRRIFISAKLPEVIKLMDGKDVVEQYLTLMNAHDGTGLFRCFFTAIRPVCENTEQAAIHGQDNGVRFRHVGNDLTARIAQARKVLSVSRDYFSTVGEAFEALAKTPVTDSEVAEYFRYLYPDVRKKAHTLDRSPVRAELLTAYNSAPGADIAIGTWWGAYNAVTSHETNGRWADSKIGLHRRFEVVNTGDGRQRMERAFSLAMEMAEVG